MFITPGALLVVLRFFASIPPTPESTLARLSDVSADMVVSGEGAGMLGEKTQGQQ